MQGGPGVCNATYVISYGLGWCDWLVGQALGVSGFWYKRVDMYLTPCMELCYRLVERQRVYTMSVILQKMKDHISSDSVRTKLEAIKRKVSVLTFLELPLTWEFVGRKLLML